MLRTSTFVSSLLLGLALSVLPAPSTAAEPKVADIPICEKATKAGFRRVGDRIYTHHEFRPHYGGRIPGPEKILEAMIANDIVPVVVLIPTRPLVAPVEKRPDDYDYEQAHRGYKETAKWLEGNGALVVDLLETASDDRFFFDMDQHWAPDGARMTAELVAEKIRSHPASKGIPNRRFETVEKGNDSHGNAATWALGKMCPSIPSTLARFKLYSTVGSDAEESLFGETSPDVVNLTDSYGTAHYNYDGFMRDALQADVLRVSVPAGQALAAMATYFQSPEYREHRPKFVVWNIAIRDVKTSGSTDKKFPPMWSAASFRHIVPSIYACKGDAVLNEVSVDAREGEVPLFSGSKLPAGAKTYLYAETTAPMPEKVAVLSSFVGGERDVLKLHRYDRVPPVPRLWAAFPEDSGPLSTVSLRFPAGTTGKVNAKLCSYQPAAKGGP